MKLGPALRAILNAVENLVVETTHMQDEQMAMFRVGAQGQIIPGRFRMQSNAVYVGVDVGSRTLVLARHGESEVATFENTKNGRKALLNFLKKKAKRKPIRVLLESTGNYGLDLALELNERKRVEVVYINPRVASAFAKAAGLRAKTDTVDALMLAAMCANGHGRTWAPPAPHLRQLRAATRRIRAMVNTRTAEKNRLKALLATTTTPTFVREEVELSIQHLTDRITLLRKHTLQFAMAHSDVAKKIRLLCSIPGIAEDSAMELCGEILCLPQDITARQLVACAGLDPRVRQSGRRDSRRHITKMGSPYLRMILHLAALNGVRLSPVVRRRFEALTGRGKPKMVAYVAISRKLLHTIHGMLKNETPFDEATYSGSPA